MDEPNHVAVAIIAYSGVVAWGLYFWAMVTGRLIKPSAMNQGGDG